MTHRLRVPTWPAVRLPAVVLAALTLAVSSASAAPPVPDLGPAAVPGQTIHLRLTLYPALPSGAIMICKARLERAGLPNGVLQPDAPMAMGTVVAGGALTMCVLEIPPAAWRDRSAGATVLRYEVDMESRPGILPNVRITGSQSLAPLQSGSSELDLNVQLR